MNGSVRDETTDESPLEREEKVFSMFNSRAVAHIDLGAFTSNLKVAHMTCAEQSLLPIIKANGYGHGLEAIGCALLALQKTMDGSRLEGCAVAALSEAQRLRAAGWDMPIVLLPGCINAAELQECRQLNVDLVIHSLYQVALVQECAAAAAAATADAAMESGSVEPPPALGITRVWLKANTGMNRLGMNEGEWREAYVALSKLPLTVVAMSHLACADDLESSATLDAQQRFETLVSETPVEEGVVLRKTLAASGGILAWPRTHFDIVRPGIMMYGSSPFAPMRSAKSLGLKPVMTLRSRLISINEVGPGTAVGYGASFVAEKTMKIGTVTIGYGDGYPRKAPSGTPVLVQTSSGMCRTALAGRVSMDMITIDVTDLDVAPGAEVVLWGEGLPADEIALCCGTIAYELFCQVTPRVERHLV